MFFCARDERDKLRNLQENLDGFPILEGSGLQELKWLGRHGKARPFPMKDYPFGGCPEVLFDF